MIDAIDTAPTHFEILLSYYGDIPETRYKTLHLAIAAGASDAVLTQLCKAARVSRKATIILPAHRFENLSRGRGWARQGTGDNVLWGEKVEGGYRCGPGKWSIGATDGFQRKDSTEWRVSNIMVGSEVWSTAI